MSLRKEKVIVAVSGGFDPVHVGHIEMFQKARALGDRLVVILNADVWLMKKKGYVFMPEQERKKLLEALRDVDEVFLYKPNPLVMDVSGALRTLQPAIFANGGDRRKERDIPETAVCKELGIRMVFGCGTKKRQSSSKLVARAVAKKTKIISRKAR